MIEFLLGKTGSGKSYLALKRAAEFLHEWDDNGIVVTQLAIHTGKLAAYLKKKYPDKEPDVVGRVRFLQDHEARQFFLFREFGNALVLTSKEQQQNLQFPDFFTASREKHVLYIIDEAHLFFDSREWQNVGLTLNFFCSQHRKFNCDIIFVTQFLDQVEKRLRNHAVKFYECVNFGVRRLAFWKLPKVFRVYETPKPPPYPAEWTSTCRMDFELAECYDTTAGVGTKGGGSPEKKRQKGLPFWTLPAFGAVLVAGFWFAPDAAILGITKALSPETAARVAPVAGVGKEEKPATVSGAPHAPSFRSSAADIGPLPPRGIVQPYPRDEIRVRGYSASGARAIVVLSDDTTVTENSPRFGGIDRRGNAVKIDGVWLPLVPLREPVIRASAKSDSPAEVPERGPIITSAYTDERVVPEAASAAASRRTLEKPSAFGNASNPQGGKASAPAARPAKRARAVRDGSL